MNIVNGHCDNTKCPNVEGGTTESSTEAALESNLDRAIDRQLRNREDRRSVSRSDYNDVYDETQPVSNNESLIDFYNNTCLNDSAAEQAEGPFSMWDTIYQNSNDNPYYIYRDGFE